MRTTFPMLAAAAILAIAMPSIACAAGQDADPDAAARAAIGEALDGAAYAKLSVSEHFATKHEWAHDATAIGYRAPEAIPASVSIADGTIVFTFTAPAGIAGKTLRLVPTDGGEGTVRWRCEAPELQAVAPDGCH